MEIAQPRVLVLQGSGTVSKAPDIMVFHTTLAHVSPTYKEGMVALNKQYKAFVQTFESNAFDPSKIQTSSIDVQVWDATEKREKSVRVSQTLTFEADIDLAKLALLLDALRTQDDFNFSLSYRIRDEKAARRDALEAAVSDATMLARVLSKATGVTLGEIVKIEYGETHARPGMMRAMASPAFDALTPIDLDVQENVSITWEIVE